MQTKDELARCTVDPKTNGMHFRCGSRSFQATASNVAKNLAKERIYCSLSSRDPQHLTDSLVAQEPPRRT